MANKPNLRLATPILPLQCEIEEINGKQKLKGLKVLTNIVELFERAGFNVSLVPVDEPTTGRADENGTYNGLYGAVQSGKADTSIIAAPIRLSESIGQFTPVIYDAANVIRTKREPAQVFEGTLDDCLATLGTLNNLILGVMVVLILLFLSLLASKRASWNFFAQLMTENFVQFRFDLWLLTFLVGLLMVRAIFGSAYSTDVTVANPPKLINSLEDLAKSELLPIWFEGDPSYQEFKQGVNKAYSDVFNMGPNNRSKTISPPQCLLNDYSNLFAKHSILYFEPFTSTITKHMCKYKSSEICSGSLRMFISEPFSRTAWVFVYSRNASASTADAMKKYANQFLQQSLYGDTLETPRHEYLPPSPKCESEINKGVEAVAASNRVTTKLVPWFEMICALIAATTVFLVEILITIITFIFSVRRFVCM